jgi:arylsulfatase
MKTKLAMAVFCVVALAVSTASSFAQTKKPNVVIIFCDDMGWGDPGAFGGGETRGAPTPNIDRMMAEGARFTQWYGQASCTAGRASFMTGRIPIRSALSVVIGPGDPNKLHKATPTIAEFYKKNGYSTYMSGKWHLGDVPDSYPIEHGFDEMKHMLCYYAGVYGYRDPELHPWFPNWDPKFVALYDKLVNDGEYEGVAGQPAKQIKQHFGYADLATIDDEQAASAQDYIKSHAKGDKPFFMYIAFMKLHQPNNPAPEWKGKSHQGNYSDSTMELDANVGKVMDSIREAGIDKDTIVVFSSDNGAWIDAWPDAGYSPFRGMKGTAFEGGWRVASSIWAPGRIQPGTVLNGMMSHMDIWPTTAAMAGLTPPAKGEMKDNEGKPIYFDGIDNSAYVLGKSKESARQTWIYIEGTDFLAVRYQQWKFMWTAKDTWLGPKMDLGGLCAMYNLQMDPGENYDMIFNGAAMTRGDFKTSPGRYAGADNGWAYAYANIIVNDFKATIDKYPNMKMIPATASLGSDLPQFIRPDLAPTREK